MDWGWVPIVVAVIAGPMMWMLHRLDKKNDQQHADNGKVLVSIKEAVLENRDDIREVKADVRSLKDDHRHLAGQHLDLADRLEQHMGEQK
jgi:hypothetical protein